MNEHLTPPGERERLNGSHELNNEIDQLTGGEHFLIGLSPQYWAHTPMLMEQFHRLALVDGIDCILLRTPMKLVPVCKCTLMGIIVNVELKWNGSILYLIDDGTGMVDCIEWTENDIFPLNSTIPTTEHVPNHFQIGQMVRVMGRIKVLTIGNVSEVIQFAERKWEIREAVREVHVNVIESITPEVDARGLDTGLESLHWLKCLYFYENCHIDGPHQHRNQPHESFNEFSQQSYSMVRNGRDVLDLLGPCIAKAALARTDLPSSDDTIGAWKVFGTSCRCDLPYKESLLYCHCQATIEPLDAQFIFRDAVLSILLEHEEKCNPSYQFHYKSILSEPVLESVATQVLCKAESGVLQRLFVKTFSALRKDGIIQLLDSDNDIYQLVSRDRVLEPYLETMADKSIENNMRRKALLAEQPPFMHNVPNSRIQYVKRCIQDRKASKLPAIGK